MKLKLTVLALFFSCYLSYSQDSMAVCKFINYPGNSGAWDFRAALGVGVTSLPIEVVEEEINRSPILRIDSRLDLPYNFSANMRVYSNYLVNFAQSGIDYNLVDKKLAVKIGFDVSGWFGHLDMSAIQLKARGLTYLPNISAGTKIDDVLLSARFEVQFATIWTDDNEESFLGKRRYPDKGLGLQLNLEQALWNDNWVLLGLKINYTKFYYQTWLSYNSLDEYLIYPEIIFGFIL